METQAKNKLFAATKWSVITETLSKLFSPIINMILARLLTPEAFGVVATITMITSFADMFTDAGFQKYLVQHEFYSKEEKDNYATVAFWTNLLFSLVLWFVIGIASEQIAVLVGNPGLGKTIVVACVSLPITAFCSIQMALYRRIFDFKTLFSVRLVTIIVPFVITIPLALLGGGYWALILGTIFGNILTAVILVVHSKWKPKLFYSYKILKKMLSFSVWSLLEQLAIWLTYYADIFIIGSLLTVFYVGVYKTSISTIDGIMRIITSATTPVLFSALSRLQNNEREFNYIFFKFQRLVSILVIPMGVGIYVYKELITNILLGNQWSEAIDFIGLWGFMTAVSIIFGYYSSEAYRSKGYPKLSFLAQVLHLVVLIPVIYLSAQKGYETLIYAKSYIRIQYVLVHLLIMHFVLHISIWKMIHNVLPSFLCAGVMGGIGLLLKGLNHGLAWDLFSIGICIAAYSALIMLFPKNRNELVLILKKIINMNDNSRLRGEGI